LKSLASQKGSWIGYVICIVILHIFGILCLFMAARHNPALWGLGLLAYTLGLRHAFDVDHIAAIDNTVRKLVQQKRNSFGVGFYFSLGHSTVVFLMVIATALSVQWVQKEMPQFQEVGGMIGASVSGLFLLMIGVFNFAILVNLYKLFRKFRNGQHNTDEFDKLLQARGFFSRMIGPFYKFIGKSWHVYPLGFLFGLGFDTASEISLIAISASAAKEAIPFSGILAFPILFAAGMSMMDTADGIFMTTAYRWAFDTPLRKLYYNLSVTTLAVVAALLIGVVELTQVISSKLGWVGGFWVWIQNINFGTLGYILVILFVMSWAISYGIWKGMKIEKRWGSADV
jgi:high-affinity nickel-transport protein